MKRLIFILTLLLAAITVQAENYFTMGENDTLRIEAGSDTVTVPVRAHFDGRVSRWTLSLSWPESLEGVSVTEGPDMTVPYLDSQGEECFFNAAVLSNADLTVISSIVTAPGYWPYGGGYIAYGSASWAAGDYDEMFYMTFAVGQGFSGDVLDIDGLLAGEDPFGGGVGNGVLFYKKVTVIVTRPFGDLDGDGKVTISDVTELINLLLSGTATADCDLDGDGQVTISDVTALINYLLSHQW